MKRNVIVIAISLLSIVFASWGSAQEPTFTDVFDQIKNSKDIEAVRMVVMREIEGCLKGNVEQINSCYDADNFIGYFLGGNPDPKTWTIGLVGRDELKTYVDYNKGNPEKFKKNADIYQTAEVQHVNVKGNNALAVAKQNWVTPDKNKGKTTTDEWESVWFLKKNTKGEWKITGWLSMATSKQVVTDLVNE